MGSRRRRPLDARRVAQGAVPYLLITPVVVAIGAILGYPLYHLVSLSFQRYGLPELIQRQGSWVGLDNYRSVLEDRIFWDTLVRTVVFTAANVGLTMVVGTLIALLLLRLSTPVRILLTSGLVLVWSMPAVVAVQVWYWMTNFQNGVLNYILTEVGFGDYFQHDWYASTLSHMTRAESCAVAVGDTEKTRCPLRSSSSRAVCMAVLLRSVQYATPR